MLRVKDYKNIVFRTLGYLKGNILYVTAAKSSLSTSMVDTVYTYNISLD